jgi:AbrB family looped-hinge helix DNA binding protein
MERMKTVTVSSKYQIVLPKMARQLLGVKVGQKMVVIAYDNRIVLVSERPIQEARGSLKGIDTTIERADP